MMRIVHVFPDNAVHVFQPALDDRREGEDQNAWLQRTSARARPADAVSAHVVGDEHLPSSHEHRDAWVWNGSKVVVDPSRIRPPAPVEDAIAHMHNGQDVQALRSELSQLMRESFFEMKEDLLGYHYELQYAINALKPDAEVPTRELQAVRAAAQQRLAEIGAKQGVAWQDLASRIIAKHDADADRLVRA